MSPFIIEGFIRPLLNFLKMIIQQRRKLIIFPPKKAKEIGINPKLKRMHNKLKQRKKTLPTKETNNSYLVFAKALKIKLPRRVKEFAIIDKLKIYITETVSEG